MRTSSRKAFLAVSTVLIALSIVGYHAAEALGSSLAEPIAEVPVTPKATKAFPVDKVSKLARGAVFIVTPSDNTHTGGTGFLIQTKNQGILVITNRHVCEAGDAANTRHRLIQGDQQFVADQIKKSDLTDLCMIKPPPEVLEGRTPFQLSPVDLVPGEHVKVFGHPYLRPLTESEGYYVNILRERLGMSGTGLSPDRIMLIGRLDFMVFPGNSGSPLLNMGGQVSGVIFAMEGATRNGLFIPLSELKRFLETQE